MLDPTSRRLKNDELLAICRRPEPPSGLFVSHPFRDDTHVTFSWNASRRASTYGLFLGLNPDPPAIVDIVGTSFTRKLLPGTTYYWHVLAQNDEGMSGSEEQTFTTSGTNPCGTLAAPARLGIATYPYTKPTWRYEMNWDPVEEATGYLIEETTPDDPAFNNARAWKILVARTHLMFTHTISENTIFLYRVRAVKDIEDRCAIEGPPSEPFMAYLVYEPSEAEEP